MSENVIETVAELMELPDMAVFLDPENTAMQVSRSERGIFYAWGAGEQRPYRVEQIELPVRVIHRPV